MKTTKTTIKKQLQQSENKTSKNTKTKEHKIKKYDY